MASNTISLPRRTWAAGDVRSQGPTRLLLLTSLQGCLLAVLAAIGLLSKTGGFAFDELILPASVLLTAVTAWNFFSWAVRCQYLFEPYALFCIAATLFNGGQGLLEAFQLNPNGILLGKFSSELTVSALYLVTLGLASMHFGALAGMAQKGQPRLAASETFGPDIERSKASRMAGWIFIGISIVPFFVVLRDTVETSLAQGYGGLYGRSKDDLVNSPILILANFIVPGVFFLLAGSRGRKTSAGVATLFVALYSVTMLAVGVRAPAAMVMISFAWLYNRLICRISRTAMLVFGVFLLSTFSFIAAIRETPGFWEEPARLADEAYANLNNPLVGAISEMGGTLVTVVHTIGLVPTVRPFDLGTSYAYAASTAIPNVGFEVHPAVAHGLLGDWLINTVDRSRAQVGGGLGFSFIAEVYANFGWYGVIPVLACLGYFLVRLIGWGTGTADPAKVAFVATFLASFLYFARGESAVVVRSFAWYSLAPYLAVSMITKNRSMRRAAA